MLSHGSNHPAQVLVHEQKKIQKSDSLIYCDLISDEKEETSENMRLLR